MSKCNNAGNVLRAGMDDNGMGGVMNDFAKILNEQFEDRDVQKHEAMKQVRVHMCLIPDVLNWHIAVENAKAAHASEKELEAAKHG